MYSSAHLSVTRSCDYWHSALRVYFLRVWLAWNSPENLITFGGPLHRFPWLWTWRLDPRTWGPCQRTAVSRKSYLDSPLGHHLLDHSPFTLPSGLHRFNLMIILNSISIFQIINKPIWPKWRLGNHRCQFKYIPIKSYHLPLINWVNEHNEVFFYLGYLVISDLWQYFTYKLLFIAYFLLGKAKDVAIAQRIFRLLWGNSVKLAKLGHTSNFENNPICWCGKTVHINSLIISPFGLILASWCESGSAFCTAAIILDGSSTWLPSRPEFRAYTAVMWCGHSFYANAIHFNKVKV